MEEGKSTKGYTPSKTLDEANTFSYSPISRKMKFFQFTFHFECLNFMWVSQFNCPHSAVPWVYLLSCQSLYSKPFVIDIGKHGGQLHPQLQFTLLVFSYICFIPWDLPLLSFELLHASEIMFMIFIQHSLLDFSMAHLKSRSNLFYEIDHFKFSSSTLVNFGHHKLKRNQQSLYVFQFTAKHMYIMLT